MTQSTTATQRSVGDEFLQAQRVAETVLSMGAQLGIVAEIAIRPGNHARFASMSRSQRAELLEVKPPAVDTYIAALEYAGETISELTRLRIEQIVGRAQRAGKAQRLIDTPEARAQALSDFGIAI